MGTDVILVQKFVVLLRNSLKALYRPTAKSLNV
jgi:hypothetical protein